MNKINKCLLVALALVSSVTSVPQTPAERDAGPIPLSVIQAPTGVENKFRKPSVASSAHLQRDNQLLKDLNTRKRQYENRIGALLNDLVITTGDLASRVASLNEKIEHLSTLKDDIDDEIDEASNRLASATE